MDKFQEAHFFTLPSQGNIYSNVNLHLTDGSVKVLHAVLKGKVFCYEFKSDERGRKLTPVSTEVPFAHIPDGAEIVAMDAFNQSSSRDHFFLGIAIFHDKKDGNKESYLNIYSEPESASGVLNLEALAQNCVIIDLKFTPYHLVHYYLWSQEPSKEFVFLLGGSDEAIHVYREDPVNHVFCEGDMNEAFPELTECTGTPLWVEVYYANDRLSAIATKCGSIRLWLFNCETGQIMSRAVERFEAPVSRVLMFNSESNYEGINCPRKMKVDLIRRGEKISPKGHIHMLVANTSEKSIVYMNILAEGLKNFIALPLNISGDTIISACACDFNYDKILELVVGTFSSIVYFFQFDGAKWRLIGKDRMFHSVHSISYVDFTGDGLKELIISTSAGIHVFQHKPHMALEVFYYRLDHLKNRCVQRNERLDI